MNQLELTDEQLNVVNRALEFYLRVGIGQFTAIKDHPTFEQYLYEICIPNKNPEVGDHTNQGEILEIKDGKALINGSVKNGRWSKEQEWKLLEDVKLSTDYGLFHDSRDVADQLFASAKLALCKDTVGGLHGSWGIYNKNVDESCRVAFDIHQVIRHEKWKNQPERGSMTTDSSVTLTTKDSDKIKCKLNVEEAD